MKPTTDHPDPRVRVIARIFDIWDGEDGPISQAHRLYEAGIDRDDNAQIIDDYCRENSDQLKDLLRDIDLALEIPANTPLVTK